MKTPLTDPGVPAYLVARWTLIEEKLAGEKEKFLLSLTRHIALGCSDCRQEEIMDFLTSWPDQITTMREALLLIDVFMVQYLKSDRGKREMTLLHKGEVPVFLHTKDGPSEEDGFGDSHERDSQEDLPADRQCNDLGDGGQ